jgi:ABC-type multidrug transport system fused ATPase/permease subunit
VLLASAAALQRVLAPALAWTLVERSVREKLAATVLFGGLFTFRTLLQRVATARTQSELVERTASSILSGDVLRADVLPDQDVHLEAAHGVFRSAQALSQTLPNASGDLTACVLLVGVIATLEPARVVAFGALVASLAVGVLFASRRAVARDVQTTWKLQERVYEAFTDTVQGRLEIVASGRRDGFMAELGGRARAWAAGGARVARSTVLSGRLALIAVVGLVGAALLASGQLHGSLAVSLTDAALCASVTPAFVGVAQGVSGLVGDQRWLRLLARIVGAGAPRGRPGELAPPPLPAPVVFDRVSFRYEVPGAGRDAGRGPEARGLSEVSFDWNGCDVLALAGANGSGKSTCLRMLVALARPLGGSVHVGGVALASLDSDVWRSCVAFLPQRPYLPPRGSLRAAVAWPLSGASDDRILRSLDRVGLLALLLRQEKEPLEVRVDSLSVGERQRVALARLLCADASLFLLDEPDANLDRAGIALVAGLIRELGGRAMVAFAAHTPELLEVADRVVVLSGGRVVEPGRVHSAARAQEGQRRG